MAYNPPSLNPNSPSSKGIIAELPDIPRLAAQAYSAYALALGPQQPDFDKLPRHTREAWCAAVDEILRRL